MKRNSRRCMNIPDYFLGKPYHKVVSRGEQIKPNLFFVRDGDACAFVRHPARATPTEKPARGHCEIHSDHLPLVTPVTSGSNDHFDRPPPPRHTCGLCLRKEPESEHPQRPRKTRGLNHKDNQKQPGATTPASPCHCASQSAGTAAASLTHCQYYPSTPNVHGMTHHQEHYHRSCHSPAPAPTPAMGCSHHPMEIPRAASPHMKCTCKRPAPPPRTEARPNGCCCSDDAKSESSFEYTLSDDSASDSSVGAVIEDTAETAESGCNSCHHYQLVCCCRHGVLYGTR